MHCELETLEAHDLQAITGGAWWSAALKVAGRVGSKAVPILNAASTAYSAYEAGSAYADARNRGDSVGSSLWQGAKAFVIGR